MGIRIFGIYFGTPPTSGTCGNGNLKWQIVDKQLIISGEGRMDDYDQINTRACW